jgi:hypothetical protein
MAFAVQQMLERERRRGQDVDLSDVLVAGIHLAGILAAGAAKDRR